MEPTDDAGKRINVSHLNIPERRITFTMRGKLDGAGQEFINQKLERYFGSMTPLRRISA